MSTFGSTHIVTVTGYNSEGDGVARLSDGRVVFIRGAARDDILEIKLTTKHPRSARAEIVRILTPSQHRINPDCHAYPDCGGCNFRHITYDEELAAKLQRVNDSMKRLGMQSIKVNEILQTGQTNGYRNKAVLHCDGSSIGFYRSRSHDIIPIDHCLLLKDDINMALKTLPNGSNTKAITIRSGRNGLKPPLEEELDGLIFYVRGFFQVNIAAALLLYNKVREYAAMSKNETLIDMYCGVGSMTLFVGRDAKHALGIEQNAASVEAARENADRNGFSFIEFINADAAAWEASFPKPDCIIVDPPRKGLSKEAVKKIIESAPNRIVYVSCDPATLARDLKAINGYTPINICAVDMFPRTSNIECCCLLTKSK
ncbi:MAG: class I SAM-dependent RNA methyltransferase [Oscillospiraceae bacterium]|jgi:23S rRNA (uracil1939-C5)-methyltransferase|nr:class I SAM-dependent RNA methyltransferase [Oscillospiraceae bacterium]